MLIKAQQRYIRQSPRKVRLVADAIRDLALPKAIEQLSVLDKKSSLVVLKVMKQAIANAQNNMQLNPVDLVIDSIVVDEGPHYKRFRPVSRGRAHAILKRTCHVTIVLKSTTSTVVDTKKVAKAKSTEKIVDEKDAKVTQPDAVQKASSPKVKADQKVTAKTAQKSAQPKLRARTTSK